MIVQSEAPAFCEVAVFGIGPLATLKWLYFDSKALMVAL